MAKKSQLGYKDIEERLQALKNKSLFADDIGYKLLYAFGKSEKDISRYKEGKGVLKTFDGLLIKGLLCYRGTTTARLTDELERLKHDVQVLKAAPLIIAVSDGKTILAFDLKEKETYDVMGQYWLDDTESSEHLGVGTYMEHARNYLTADVVSFKLMANHKTQRHDMEVGITYKTERISEQAREYEMRDSSGYSIPHSADRLDLIYTLTSQNDVKSHRIEAYMQDTYRFAKGENFFTLNYGVRLANWSFSKETIVSPRASLAVVPAFNHDLTFRFATGLYYQAPFYKEMRDTVTENGITVAKLNEKIKSQRSLQFIAAMDYRFKMLDRPFRFTTEVYYKALSNLIPYNIQNVKVTYYGENLASGYTAGLDLKLYGEFVPGTDSWLTFSLMKAQMKMNGVSFPQPTDQKWAINLHFTDYFPGTDRWRMTLRLAYADGLPFGAPHRGIERQNFRAPAYKRADIGMNYRAIKDGKGVKNLWLGVDCLNLFGISNVNSYYWVTDVSSRQWAVPNYLTGRQINGKVTVEF